MRFAAHQAQQVVWRRLAGDDVGRAHVHARSEEHVELRAVIEGQGVQHDVALGRSRHRPGR